MKKTLITSAYWRTIVAATVLTIGFLCFNVGAHAQEAKPSHQCEATTKAGTKCQHKTTAKYCKQHDPESPKCGAPTKSGKPCTRTVKVAGDKCFQHKG